MRSGIIGRGATILFVAACAIATPTSPDLARAGSADDSKPFAPPARPATWTPDPGPWEILERETIRSANGLEWRIESGRRRIGRLSGGRGDVEVDLPRVVVERIQGGDTTRVAVLLPDGNRDVSLHPPGDPEESAVPSEAIADAYGRWPNPCSFTILDATGRLDLDGDGTPEVAVRRLCSCTSAPCSGIVFITLDPAGPRLLDVPSIIGNVEIGTITVHEIDSGKDPARPILEIAPDLLDGCRFVALAGVRGASDCADCCLFPVLARPAQGGYEVFYDPQRQKERLNQAQKDVGYVAAGPPGPLRSLEEAQVARAASFYYLTGLGSQTRGLLSGELGARARDVGVQQLLGRLDDIFLGRSSGQR